MEVSIGPIRFDVLRLEHIEQVAKLHVDGIATGFISSLGLDFVTALYETIAESRTSFGFIAEKNGKVVGFIVFTSNLHNLYKSVILKKGVHFTFLLAGKLFSLKSIKKIFETLFYPNRTRKMNLPSAELLSVVVADGERGKGLAVQLIRQGLQECVKREIHRVKVMVASANESANRLYQKCGFELIAQIKSHGILSNIYVVDTHRTPDGQNS